MVPESGSSRTIPAMDLLPINTLDLVVVVLVIVAAVVGYRSGAIPQILGLIAAGAAIVLIVHFAPEITRAMAGIEQPARAIVAIVGAFLIVAGAQAIGAGLGGTARNLVGGIAGRVDSILGAAVGAAEALVVVWFVGGLLAVSALPAIAGVAQQSVAVRSLLQLLPPPGEVIGQVGAIVGESGLPQVFSGLEPVPATPVDLPAEAKAAAIAARALAGTVKVESQGCGATFSGTGFAVRPGYFITNAHVVAGATRITIQGATGSTPGTVVLFDPDLDVAVVHAPGLLVPSLVLATTAPGRGTVAAALGHPNGGGLTVIPAAVTAQVRARGRDLYGDAPVVRDVLELRAAIEPGDSGGPLVLADGTVGGVVFAESRTDTSVGYALDPTDVAVAVLPGLETSRPVATGPCIR
jgi:S1-C subfamily serine protease